jgi:hypothetical protein
MIQKFYTALANLFKLLFFNKSFLFSFYLVAFLLCRWHRTLVCSSCCQTTGWFLEMLALDMRIFREKPVFPTWSAVMKMLLGKSCSWEGSRPKLHPDGCHLKTIYAKMTNQTICSCPQSREPNPLNIYGTGNKGWTDVVCVLNVTRSQWQPFAY